MEMGMVIPGCWSLCWPSGLMEDWILGMLTPLDFMRMSGMSMMWSDGEDLNSEFMHQNIWNAERGKLVGVKNVVLELKNKNHKKKHHASFSCKKMLIWKDENGLFRWDGKYSQAMTNHRNCILQYKEEDLIKNSLSTSCHYIPNSKSAQKYILIWRSKSKATYILVKQHQCVLLGAITYQHIKISLNNIVRIHSHLVLTQGLFACPDTLGWSIFQALWDTNVRHMNHEPSSQQLSSDISEHTAEKALSVMYGSFSVHKRAIL